MERNFVDSLKKLAENTRCDKLLLSYRGVEQWLARWAHNPKAVGSSPTPAIVSSIHIMAV